jgi:hypothetical protein
VWNFARGKGGHEEDIGMSRGPGDESDDDERAQNCYNNYVFTGYQME